MDSTGIEFRGDGEWQARENGVQSRCQWRQVQLTIDAATSDIPTVEFTLNRDGNSPVQPDLLEQISVDENISTLTTNVAYGAKRCHTMTLARDAVPIMPIRKNRCSWKDDCPAAIARNETLQAA